MAALDEIISQIPMAQLASKLGVDEQTAEQATRQALPALVGGMQANASDEAGAQSLEQAVGQHDPSLVEGGIDVESLDTADGEKIVHNVFGDNEQPVMNQLGSLGGGDSGLMAKLLPMLAPIVMAFLAKQFAGGGGGTTAAQGAGGGGTASGGGGLGDLLGSLLGGGSGGTSGAGTGTGGIGDLLGGLLGGGKR